MIIDPYRFAAAGPPSYRSSAHARTTAATGTLAVSTPSGTADGDIMIAFAVVASTTDTIATPSGWTLVEGPTNSTGGTNIRVYAWSHTASSEGASTTWTKTGTGGNWRIAIASYSGSSGVDGSAHASAGGTGVSTTVVFPGITTASANTLVVEWIGLQGGSSSGTPCTGFTERLDTIDVNGPNLELADLAFVAAGAIASDSTATSSVVNWAVAQIAIKP